MDLTYEKHHQSGFLELDHHCGNGVRRFGVAAATFGDGACTGSELGVIRCEQPGSRSCGAPE